MREFAHIIFDLDDTLLDTSKLLIPRAVQDSCQAMIEAGLRCKMEECLKARREFVQAGNRGSVYDHLIEVFGITEANEANLMPAQVSKIGYESFYCRNVPSDIQLIDGVETMLNDLRSRYDIHLVTSGNLQTQSQKTEALGIRAYFKSIHYVDPAHGETKQAAFQDVLNLSAESPERLLSVGNRLDTDIGAAKRIGLRTCWVRHGEYASMLPKNEFEIANFEISRIEELGRICRL